MQVIVGDLPALLVKLKPFNGTFKEDEIKEILCASGFDISNEVEFEGFLKVMSYLFNHVLYLLSKVYKNSLG